jgi:hypothetical protein
MVHVSLLPFHIIKKNQGRNGLNMTDILEICLAKEMVCREGRRTLYVYSNGL